MQTMVDERVRIEWQTDSLRSGEKSYSKWQEIKDCLKAEGNFANMLTFE